MSFKKVFLITLIISLSLSALIGIVIFLIGRIGSLETKIILTTLTIGAFSLTGLCCGSLLDKKRFPIFAWFGIVLSIWGFLLATSVIWDLVDYPSSFSKIMTITIVWVSSVAHASLVLLIESKKPIVNISLSITLLFIALVCIELTVLIAADFDNIDDIWYRILGVYAILDVLGTIITPIIYKIGLIEKN